MTYYESCGWAPFGWTQVAAENVGECGTNTKLENGKCVVVDNIECGTNTKLENGKCVVDMQSMSAQNESPAKFGGLITPGLDNKYSVYDGEEKGFMTASTYYACHNDPSISPELCPFFEVNIDNIKEHCSNAYVNDPTWDPKHCELTMVIRAVHQSSLQNWCVANPDAEEVALDGFTYPCAPLRDLQETFLAGVKHDCTNPTKKSECDRLRVCLKIIL